MIVRKYIIADLAVKKFLTAELDLFTLSISCKWTPTRNDAVRFDTAVQAINFEITDARIFFMEDDTETCVVYWDTLERIDTTDKTNELQKNGS